MKSPLLPFSSASRGMSLLSLSALLPPQEVANAMQCVGEGDYVCHPGPESTEEGDRWFCRMCALNRTAAAPRCHPIFSGRYVHKE